MPSWAENNASQYWNAADLYERANGRLYVSADFALPRDLSAEDGRARERNIAEKELIARLRRLENARSQLRPARSRG
jgi:hypothetical protein